MQNFLAKYFIYGFGQFIRREHVFKYLKLLHQTEFLTLTKITKYQQENFIRLASFVKDKIPFYSKLYKHINYSAGKNFPGIDNFPLISKLDVRNNFYEMSCREKNTFITKKTTGGSTGQAVITLKDRYSSGYQRASMYRGYNWAGIDIGDKQVRFWGIPFVSGSRIKYKFIDFFMNRIRLSAFSFKDDDLNGYYQQIRKFKPQYFYGYVSMIYEFAMYCKKNELNGEIFNLKAIVTTSEVLYEYQRKLIQEVFGCRVYNEYGCGEFGPIAFECPEGSLHIHSENLIVEIVKDGVVIPQGESGEIVVTELNNYYMPLIRYRMGDIGILSYEKCPCGRELPVLKKIIGRALDFILDCSGRKIHGEYFNYVMEDIQNKMQGIKQYQIVQNDLKAIDFKIVKDNGFISETMKYLDDRLKSLLGNEMKITYSFVDSIDRQNSGKLRLVVSNLNH